MFWGILVAAVVLAIIGILVWAVMWDTRMMAAAERDVLNREHELALADREAEMWKAMLGTEGDMPPGIFRQRRVLPTLVGRSQVISPKPRGQIDLNERPVGPPPSKPADPRQSVETPAVRRERRLAERSREIKETGTTEAHLASGTRLEAVPEPSLPGVKPCRDTKPHGPHDWTDRSTSDVRQFRCAGVSA